MESIGTVLFETRLGCVDEEMPADVQGFIDAIGDMFYSLLPSMLFYEKQKKLGSPYVKRHFAAWDTIFAFVRRVVDRSVLDCLLIDQFQTTFWSNQCRQYVSSRSPSDRSVPEYLLVQSDVSIGQFQIIF